MLKNYLVSAYILGKKSMPMTYTTPCKWTLKEPCLGQQATTRLNLGSEGEQDKIRMFFR